MDVLPLLDELQVIARNGLFYSENPYDRERYERLMDLVTTYYGQALDLPPDEVRGRLRGELGYITPKVGADVALFDDAGRILLERRRDDGRWCLPCGWVEPNESPAESVVREAREETGLDVRVLSLIDVFPIMPSALTGPHTSVAIVYYGEVTGGTLTVSHESLELRYWSIPDVPVWHGHHLDYAEAAERFWQAWREKVPSDEGGLS
ncbi:MAG TPA: NUDIX hydrolase N-terminal domain-containing protein [Anaerolineae bacterium]